MRCPSSVRQEKKGQIPPSSTFGSVQTLSGLDDAPNTPHIISLQPRTGWEVGFPEPTHSNAKLTWKHPHIHTQKQWDVGSFIDRAVHLWDPSSPTRDQTFTPLD